MERRTSSLPKICGITGIILAEVYMLITASLQRFQDTPISTTDYILRIICLAPLFGAFGVAAGTGIGIILAAIFNPAPTSKSNPPHSDDSESNS